VPSQQMMMLRMGELAGGRECYLGEYSRFWEFWVTLQATFRRWPLPAAAQSYSYFS